MPVRIQNIIYRNNATAISPNIPIKPNLEGRIKRIPLTLNVTTGAIHKHDRVIRTIGKQVCSDETRVFVKLFIGVDEPGNLRVIVPALEIIEPGLGVVVIPPVTEGVPRSHAAGGG